MSETLEMLWKELTDWWRCHVLHHHTYVTYLQGGQRCINCGRAFPADRYGGGWSLS